MMPDIPLRLELKAARKALAAVKFWIARDVHRENEILRSELERTRETWDLWRDTAKNFKSEAEAAFLRHETLRREFDALRAENERLKIELDRLRKDR